MAYLLLKIYTILLVPLRSVALSSLAFLQTLHLHHIITRVLHLSRLAFCAARFVYRLGEKTQLLEWAPA
jgi:hypothetical protein